MSQFKTFTPPAHNETPSAQPEIRLKQTADFRESYSNAVQIRMSLWDIQMAFGTMQQAGQNELELNAFQAVTMSPQHAKALWNALGQNLAQYEKTFGTINLEPVPTPAATGPVN